MSSGRQTILVLYTRLPGYTLACLKALRKISGHELHVVKYKADTLAPFELEVPEGLTFYQRDTLDQKQLLDLLNSISPSLVITAGWADSGYKQVAKAARANGIPTVCGLDNQWTGSIRQRIASKASRFVLKPFFEYLWVPDKFQYEYARRLGYARDKILIGWYSADTESFLNTSQDNTFRKRFLYVGRMVSYKGIRDIVSVAKRFEGEGIGDWSFQLIGSGPESEAIPDLPNIRHQAFLQPEELREELNGRGVFLLPSHKEPWGVVVHEMASAGFPLLTSDAVGANAGFLRSGWNGFSFPAGNQEALYQAAKKFVTMDQEQRQTYSKRSVSIAQSHTPEVWASQLLQFLDQPE